MKFLITAIIYTCFTFFISCGGKVRTEDVKQEKLPASDEQKNLNTVTLTDQQAKSVGIELANIEANQLTFSLKTNGLLKVPNQNKASVNSIYSGIIKSLRLQPGNTVSKGQIIATIANPEFIQVQEEYLSIHSKIILAEQEYNRQKELNAGNAGALKNLQAAGSALKTLTNRQSSLRQQIQLMGINPTSLKDGKLISVLAVRSPINGIVSNVLVKMGSYVEASTIVAEIVDNSRLHLDLFVYEKDMPKLKNNQLIHFTLTNNPGKEYDAQIFSLGSSFEGESKAVTVHAAVKGDKTGLIDGMNITAVISLQKATVQAVPTEAIVTFAGQDYIFMLTNEATVANNKDNEGDSLKTVIKKPHNIKKSNRWLFTRIPIAKGITDIGYTEVTLLKEIPGNSRIAVKGVFFILAKMTNTGG
jgi:cobalt-zinc-cadmium efflux system membrane fusion protein